MDRIPEERVGTILQRAAELDSVTVSLDTLRSAALEAGISADALDRALREHEVRANPAPKRKVSQNWLKGWVKRGVDSAKLFILASITGAIATKAEAIGPLAVIYWIYFIIKLVRESKGKSALPFVLSNIAITFGLAFGAALFNGEGVVGTIIAFGALTTVLGAAYIQSWLSNLIPQQTSEGNNA